MKRSHVHNVVERAAGGFEDFGADLAPEKNQKGFAEVNARLGLTDAQERISVEVFARNLFDAKYVLTLRTSSPPGGSHRARS